MTIMKLMTAAAVLALVATPVQAGFSVNSSAVTQALAASDRDPDNVKLDEGRKPAALLQFLGLKPGMHVIDMFGGNRYWSEIFSPAVGAKGKVYVWEPTQFYQDKTRTAFEAFAAKHSNVSLTATPFEALQLPKGWGDLMLINLDYHDVYWQNEKYGVKRMEPDAFVKAVYAAMKPGGIVGVVDHVGPIGGDTRETVEKYHRIDPAVVRADFERAGFKLVGESDLLRNPADPHDVLVFDPSIRGKTDRFIYKFRKPR